MERFQKSLSTQSEFTYGEVELPHFIALLKYVNVKPGAVFWDLGCGAGRAMICAALSDCGFSKICGVEYLEGLYNLCCSVVEKFKKVGGSENSTEFKVIHGDMTKIDWSDADLIYSSSICFPEPVL